MQAKILNLFSNVTTNNHKLKVGHGQSFLIKISGEKILYDTGLNAKTLLNNMETFSISPDEITKLVLSHGHADHTGGLPGFLDERNANNVLSLIAHPSFRENKIYKVLYLFNKSLACPPLTTSQENKLEMHLTAEPVQLALNLKTTGEITDRNEKYG
ncbi:MAG: MBL fold metallo-hydrolase, partial [Deltaproteobacteria bacterium]|nr:MBL fold metallo-hydrolase [Deltaproteobacteria bacterium]